MRRGIKFRVWGQTEARYLYEARLSEVILDRAMQVWDIKEYGYIFEQFTGLTDKNGIEVYEGDIITFQRWDNDTILRGPVWWDQELAAWVFGRYTHPHCGEPFDWGYSASQIREGSMKVVGNIHDEISS